MKNKKLLLSISIVLAITSLSGCGGSSATVTPTSLLGSAFKGPIDNAAINVKDALGNNLATSSSTNGKFELLTLDLPSDVTKAIFIETSGGSYSDEATGQPVTLTNRGLMTVFSADELRTIIAEKKVIALTPETTVMAKLVAKKLANGQTTSQAITSAKATVQEQLIDGTNPALGVSGDSLLLVGDLSAPTPADQTEALARNRAISFSYEAESLNLSPGQVFDLIDKRALDLEDGTLDGKENGTNTITLTDKDGNNQNLDEIDQKDSYALARSRLLNNTITRLSNGDLSDNERESLSQMGFDTTAFDQVNQSNEESKNNTAVNLAAVNLPAFNHLPVLSDEDGDPTDNKATYTLTAMENVDVTVNVPGDSWTTPMWRYNGSQLPPVIKANRGDTMTLNLVNDLTYDTTIHWHGFKIPGDQDGGPDFPVAPGSGKTYSFPMLQPAAPLWFHPHPDMQTGEQVYMGLAGIYLLDDDISKQLTTDKKLPTGNYDIPLVVQDRRFKSEVNGVRELAYMDNDADADGMLGGKILVNGAQLPKLDVETRQYRFRVYNTSNARSYDFALNDGSTFKVVATDGGLLPSPVEVDHIMLGAAERAEIVIDFGKYTQGDKLMLISKAFSGSQMMGMMGGMNGGSGMGSGGMGMNAGSNNTNMNSGNNAMSAGMMANGGRMDIMRFDIATTATDDVTLYTALPANADINTQRLVASDADKTRTFVMTMAMDGMGNGNMGTPGSGGMSGMSFVINGKKFDMNRIDELVTLADGDTEIWSIQNRSPMAHPFHAHAIQWQILDRNGKAAEGVDLGWKDTVLVQPGETVRFIGRFDPAVNTGDYMYHCHILEHEDAGMMGFFRIQ